jgi:hypothetical protein
VVGSNTFLFRLNPTLLQHQQASPAIHESYTNKTFEPYSYAWGGTREGLISSGADYGCNENAASYCTKLIQYEGWSIPEDYPIEF